MFRELLVSFFGHATVVVSLVIASFFGKKLDIQQVDIYHARVVSSESLSELMKRTESPREPLRNVPQVQTETKTLPQNHRKESQAVKSKQQSSNNTTQISKSTSKTSGFKGVKVDSEINIDYLIALRDRIQQNWQPPHVKQTLVATVYFKIGKNGNLVRVFVEKPTGNRIYDSSAFNAVKAGDPFSPLPEEFKNDHLGVHFDFIYEIE